ncbi:LLM class flavin-dependent oxidoreductase [Saccharomonospora piscinae]|uniref:LLM class flavin-dependent oxidoreductase n=1 Tax=Saccharomonospora piscinae TaxID=687388 RepID=UPI00056AE5C0|nr:LLM class flavin-dependent oxidoreductase [Saccharomonospora piscinae]
MRVGIVILPEDRWWAAEPKWRVAEEYGFDHAWTYDHLGWRSLVDGPWFSAGPTLAAAAMVTSTIRLGTFVASPNFRHPVPFAREVITLDDLADGRLVLGVGAGGQGYDAEVLGTPELSPGRRVDRFVEFVDALDGLLRTDGFDYSGEYYSAKGARNLPGCVQRPRSPLLIAANGPRAMAYAARQGEGWITTGQPGAVSTQEQWWQGVATLSARFDETLAETGRGEVVRCLSLDAAPVFSLSSREAFVDAVGRAQELGFTDVVVHWPRSGEPYQGQESVLEEVAADVLPGIQGREPVSDDSDG